MTTVIASLTTIPSRIGTCCRETLDSLIPQTKHIYLHVSCNYKRFGKFYTLPEYLFQAPYATHVTVNWMEDNGPANKYLGIVGRVTDPEQWIFFCDDDQFYHPTLISRMNLGEGKVYQNRYSTVRWGSGGLIHGFVGNVMRRSVLDHLTTFPLPECARFVDDQWMSIYLHTHNIEIHGTPVEEYEEIFRTTSIGWEQAGPDSLATLGTRDLNVATLANFFHVKFIPGGSIVV